jgi:ABC-type anion transport system duplicated permease subunit
VTVQTTSPASLGRTFLPNLWDCIALILIVGAMVLIVYGGGQTTAPLSALNITPVSLDPANLPIYALRTTMRMLLAIVCSIIWPSPLMILGTQWYILFNVIAGASAFPTDLREAAGSFHLRGWRWWIKVILPGIFPYYITGAITASGGSWNAFIVAEVASWGDTRLTASGLGAYIANATERGDFPRVVLGITVMCILVTLFNRLLRRPLYAFGERRLRLG